MQYLESLHICFKIGYIDSQTTEGKLRIYDFYSKVFSTFNSRLKNPVQHYEVLGMMPDKPWHQSV